jgi:hypothetical protein
MSSHELPIPQTARRCGEWTLPPAEMAEETKDGRAKEFLKRWIYPFLARIWSAVAVVATTYEEHHALLASGPVMIAMILAVIKRRKSILLRRRQLWLPLFHCSYSPCFCCAYSRGNWLRIEPTATVLVETYKKRAAPYVPQRAVMSVQVHRARLRKYVWDSCFMFLDNQLRFEDCFNFRQTKLVRPAHCAVTQDRSQVPSMPR